MLPDPFGFHQVQLHHENVRKIYESANGTVQRRVIWPRPSGPSIRNVAHSIRLVIDPIKMRIRHEPLSLTDHSIETTKGS